MAKPGKGRSSTKHPAAKKRSSAKGRKSSKARSTGKNVIRVDLLVDAQKKVVENFGQYLVGATDLVRSGEFSPAEWIKLSATMWTDLAKGLGEVTKKL